MKFNFEAVNRSLLSNLESVLHQWFPNGRKQGSSFCVGSLAGDPGESLKIDLKRGVWKDFSQDTKGGSDPISLYAAMQGLSQFEAAKELATHFGVVSVSADKAVPPDEFEPVTDPPEDMPNPQVQDFPIRYVYKTVSGNVLGIVCRSDEGGKKKIHLIFHWT
jgi:hypothetical protein